MMDDDSTMITEFIKEYGPWCIGWIAWMYERRQTTLAHKQLQEITTMFLRMFSQDHAAVDLLRGDDSVPSLQAQLRRAKAEKDSRSSS